MSGKRRDMNIANSINNKGMSLATRRHNSQTKFSRKEKHKNKIFM